MILLRWVHAHGKGYLIMERKDAMETIRTVASTPASRPKVLQMVQNDTSTMADPNPVNTITE